MKLFGTLLGLAGLGWLFYVNIEIAAGVTVVMIGDNLARK